MAALAFIAVVAGMSVNARSASARKRANPIPTDTTSAAAKPTSKQDSGCPSYTAVHGFGRIRSRALVEASGLVASDRNPGVLWSHNDSGSDARLFALSTEGTELGAYILSGVRANDWEDLALGPGPAAGKRYLYVGDIGDNRADRRSVVIYRVEEPLLPPVPNLLPQTLVGVTRIELSYADNRARDAEALLVDPKTAEIYVITKPLIGAPIVYRAATTSAPSARGRLEAVASLESICRHSFLPPLVTAADISRDGTLILVRTYFHAFLFQCAHGLTIAACFQAPPCPVPLRFETQGESIAFAADKSGYFTTSEGRFAPLNFFREEP